MLLLKNGQVLDRNLGFRVADVLIDGRQIVKIAAGIEVKDARVINVAGQVVVPGFIDVHVHMREPGFEHKETIRAATAAAARGGFTTIAAMPNTNPVPDSTESLAVVQDLIEKDAVVRVLPYAAITKNEAGDELVDFAMLADDVFAFSDDGRGIQSAGMMYNAMVQAKSVGKPLVAHCEDESLLFGGYLHAGDYAREHGHRGISSVSESVHVARDVLLAQATGVHYHVCHVSTSASVELIRWAKSQGIHVTAEVAPHHLLLSDKDIPADGDGISNFKMNPPLRSENDRRALIAGLLDGTIDMIATDHAPHGADEKALDVSIAPFGIVGLETAFPLLYTHFVKSGQMDLKQLIDCMASKPAAVFGLDYGVLAEGAIADIAVIDLEAEWIVDVSKFVSMGQNSPFGGYDVSSRVTLTIVDGEVVYNS